MSDEAHIPEKETSRMAEVGYISVVAALVLALYGAMAGPVGVKLR